MSTGATRELFLTLFVLLLSASYANAQSATYRLHKEASSTSGLFQLKTAGPDGTTLAVQSANLKSLAVGEYLVKAFDTQSGVPNASGVITAGSTITFTLWMNKTAASGVMFPRAKLRLNNATGTLFCTVTGSTALTTTLTKYTFSATTASSISMTTTDRLYVWVGVNVTTVATANTNAALNIEGTLNGNYDSLTVVPTPVPPPAIGSLSTTLGPVGTSVTVTGSNFGATQGTSTVTFNGTAAAPTSWSATSIAVAVPAAATTGPVVVTVNGLASNGVTFTVMPKINSLSPTSGTGGTSVTIGGTTFGATQGTSTVTFNGTTTTPTSWSATSIIAPVPSGATTGGVAVTVNGQTSNAVTFTVITNGTIAGTITRTSDGTSLSGGLVEALQAGVVKASGTTATNGSYTMANLLPGTYDLRASAIGYQTKLQNSVAVTANTTTTVNQSLDAVAAGDITYIYDELGRLISVVTPAETVTYTYDSVGNVLSISRQNSNLPSITEFSPNSGTIGTSETIYGTGFSSTASLNTVKFNGVTATVVSATATQIVTNVPAGATTGSISINTPTGLATSSTPFTVSTSTAPTITSFIPTIGTEGTALTVTGSNFETTITNDWLTFNTRYAPVTSATTTTISTSVPVLATSGRISVATPSGKATSAADFFVAPPPHPVADVEVTGRMAYGESKSVAISAADKIGLILFDGIASQRASLKVNSFSLTSTVVAIYNPDGSTLAVTTFFANGSLLDTPVLPATGTYTILIDPNGANTGSINFTLYNASDVSGTITPGGSAVTVTTTVPGQNARLTFSAIAGQRVALQISNSTFAGCVAVNDSIKNPDGTTLTSANLCSTSGFLDTVVLPVSGTFTVLVDPQGTTTGSQTVLLIDVPPDVTGSIAPGGAAVTITTTVPGQNAKLAFSGTAGQRVSLQLSNSTFTGCIAVNDSIKNPDGTTLTSVNLCGTSEYIDTVALPVTGTFTVLVDPQGTTIGSQTLLLNDVPPDVTGSITPGGSAVTITTTTSGQNAILTFNGTAGQRVSVQISNSTFTGCYAVYNTIKKPDGTTLTSSGLCGASGFLDAVALPVTGTYSILIDPQGTTVGSQTLLLNDVPADATTSITPGGPPVTLTTTIAGQNGEATFAGAANQRVSLKVTAVSLTGGSYNWVTVSIKKPDGTTLTSSLFDNAGGFIDVQTLPVTGTYTVFADLWDTSIGSVTLTLYDVPADVSVSITPGGSPVTVTNSTPGQNGQATVSGSANQRVSLNVTGVTLAGGSPNWVNVYLKKPDGTNLASNTFDASGGFIDVQTLPVAGTYSILVDPWSTSTGNVTLTVYDVPADASNSTTIGSPAVSVTTTAPGQNAQVTFTGASGQQVTVYLTANTMGTVYLRLLNPDGTALFSNYYNAGSFDLPAQTLPTAGTYKVSIDPQGTSIGSISVAVTNP